MHSSVIISFILLALTSLCLAAPTPVTAPIGAAVKYKTVKGQDAPINLIELSNRGEVQLRHKLELLEERQSDCGASPFQTLCSAGTGLNVPSLAVVAIAVVLGVAMV